MTTNIVPENLNNVLQSLQKLIKFNYNSIESLNETLSLLVLAFQQSKPLFYDENEKQLASSLLNQTIPYFKYCFDSKHEWAILTSYRQYRSGLQYLIDEFQPQGSCEEFSSIVDCDHFKRFEDCIHNRLEIPDADRMRIHFKSYQDRNPEIGIDHIPLSHWWWFMTRDEMYKKIENEIKSKKMSWKDNAKNTLKSYYLTFRGSQWDQYLTGSDEEKKLLLAKICIANYGPPTQEATKLLDGYTSEQKKIANKILKLLLKANNQRQKILISIIFIYCKSIDSDNEFVMPLFSVFTGNDPAKDIECRKYVDTQLRVYKNFNDWLSNNRLPKVEYAYPGYGFFSCSSIPEYEFDESKDPNIKFDKSPACSSTKKFFSFADKLTGITANASSVIGIIGMFTQLAPIIVAGSAIGGSSSAVYNAVRAASRLIDKKIHGESLKDRESLILYFSIAQFYFRKFNNFKRNKKC